MKEHLIQTQYNFICTLICWPQMMNSYKSCDYESGSTQPYMLVYNANCIYKTNIYRKRKVSGSMTAYINKEESKTKKQITNYL